MYSKEETTKTKAAFWTMFGQYMKPVPSSWKEKVNWLNYKTGIKDIYFKMDADTKKAIVGIELRHADDGIRHLVFEHFTQLKKLLEAATGETWQWQQDKENEQGVMVSFIGVEIEGVNIMQKQNWSKIISFLKPRIIALDAFWGDTKDGVEMMMF
ncbi:MAG TPA: DUF4268 domain-containing protein [Phnomibacter sp.]|nr:DUF4268 domain-containing protein [Phnomibacter sp.]